MCRSVASITLRLRAVQRNRHHSLTEVAWMPKPGGLFGISFDRDICADHQIRQN